MPDKKPFTQAFEADPALKKILQASQNISVTEEELLEQRMSFAFGLCQGQYDVTELALEPPQSPCNAALAAERQDQRPECNDEQNTE
jgi:hypothetical protein